MTATTRQKKRQVTKPYIHEVRIGYQTYQVNILPPNGAPYHGITNMVGSVIDVHQLGNEVETANTLIHEMLHAICHTQGLGLEHDEEERIVNAVANGMVGMLRDNPEFFMAEIMGRLQDATN